MQEGIDARENSLKIRKVAAHNRAHYIDGCGYKCIRDILKIGTSFQSLDISTNNLICAFVNITTF